MPQGLVLGPTLFLIDVKDLESNLLKIAKFAEDTKLNGKVLYSDNCDEVQDLNKLIDWIKK